MKLKRIYLLLSFVLLLVISTNAIKVNAMNTGFFTEDLSDETKITFVASINISPLSAEPEKRGVLCFDVNEQGLIAIGQTGSQDKEICVYTSQGEFLYGYTFNCTQSFCVEWDEQHVNIHFIRSDVIISLDSDGNILDIKAVQDTIDNNSHRNSLLYSTTREVGNTTYLIRNDMGIFNLIATSYSQIVVKDMAGTECVIYDVNAMQISKIITILVVILSLVSVLVVIIVKNYMKLMRNN